MTEAETHNALRDVFRSVLEDESITLTSAMTAEDLDGWDSKNYIFFVVELEKRFSVKFQAAEMEEFKTVGELFALLHQEVARRN